MDRIAELLKELNQELEKLDPKIQLEISIHKCNVVEHQYNSMSFVKLKWDSKFIKVQTSHEIINYIMI